MKLREMTSDFAEESSEGGSDTSSVEKLAESLSAIVETLNSASKGKSKGKGKKGSMGQNSPHGRPVAGHIAECGTSQRQNAIRDRQPWTQPNETGRLMEKGKGNDKSGGKSEGKGGIGQPAWLCP